MIPFFLIIEPVRTKPITIFSNPPSYEDFFDSEHTFLANFFEKYRNVVTMEYARPVQRFA